ncbi:hypothetical protein [Aneurinibacillus tyrosinisolvens]|uniref:hypothetical protein n=1 Tax=Aneurinibacillus tyrosinisolvens TaxID=1443435 RepID=UPI00063EEB8B|nr:hypothetical protein [Aneurinibacillus tyrosinisolvens]
MDNYIEGTFLKASDGSSMFHIDDTHTILLTDGKAMKVSYGGEWISGIHIGGDVIHSGGKDKLRTGDRIRIKKL